ncbi:MAG TPA: hypothetical protein VNO34_07370, partial [Actinomycetota bacterium]|nr:hypothetical protein [Actinomycetota bacterium]
MEVRIRFERFPLAVKGAFVLRGADGNPHLVEFDWAHVARVPGGLTRPFPVEARQFDVAPTRDLFVPFEVPLVELPPGWYRIETAVRVDGARSWPFPSRLLLLPWPRSEVRRGVLEVGRPARAGGRSFRVERVELTADSAAVLWRAEEGEAPEGEAAPGRAVLVADGEALDALPDEAPAAAARARARGWRSLT